MVEILPKAKQKDIYEIMDLLEAPFPPNAVSWRAQMVIEDRNNAGTYAAQALAYIDARDVMRRLDQVMTSAGWQDSYSVYGSRVLCTLELNINGLWVRKTDGAGDTHVEAEKGGVSDAFKRAAVKWGVGRYLYDYPTLWVPCEAYKDGAGKIKFKKFLENPETLLANKLSKRK